MSTALDKDSLPLPISLELSSALVELIDGGGFVEDARATIERDLSTLLNTLGVPGAPSIRIATLEGPASSPGHLIRVSVDDRRARFPSDLLEQVRSYLIGTLPVPETKAADLLAWLTESYGSRGKTIVLEFLGLACVEIIKLQPAILVGPPQVEAYAAGLPTPAEATPGAARSWPPDSQSMLFIMREALRLRLSIADHLKVARVLHEGWTAGRALAHIAEDVIAELGSGVVEIRMPADDLRRFTTRWEKDGAAQFKQLREGLFQERGLSPPTFRFVSAEELKPTSFSVKINDLPLLPAWLVGATQCLVNDTSEGLRRFGRPYEGAVPAVNPGSGQPGAVVDLGGKDVLETAGLTTWDQIQFLILSLAADLRRHGFCLVNRSMVRDHLGRLEGAFPALVKAARGQMSDERITRVVRGLIQEQVSVRDLRSVLELHLDYGLIATSSADWQRHSNEGDLLAFVRAGLRTQVTHASAGYGRRNVVVYLVDPQIERRAVEQQFSPHNEGAEAILDALRSEIAHLPSTVTLPHVLTSREARPVLQQSIASEFPRVLVIAHDELAPNAVVQPIARLTA